ncbi:MAG: serine/threonine-protein phosphatase [Anaerolineales bacterium]|nr:serine/threonine-protein phosphatase [Anaerolineales bacterium]
MAKIAANPLLRALQHLLGRSGKAGKTPAPDSLDTAPLNPQAQQILAAELPQKRIIAASAQSTGLERSHNEDSLFFMHTNSEGQELPSVFGLYIIADGMGGHRAGELASAISINTVVSHLVDKVFLHLYNSSSDTENQPLQELVREAMEDSNLNVVEKVPGGGTTLTTVLYMGNHITIGHVGDSRAYVCSKDSIKQLTRDHSLVERLCELGQITVEEAAVHPQRNVLYRAIGQGANLEIDIITHPAPQDATLILCSDGLWGVVDDHQIHKIINDAPTLQQACNDLVLAANTAGGPDNISVILVYFPPS